MKTDTKAQNIDEFLNTCRIVVFVFILIAIAMLVGATIKNPGIWNALK